MAEPTHADLERADVHDARALLRGDDECACRGCKRVAAWRAHERNQPALPEAPSAADLDRAALHEDLRELDGDEDCSCPACIRVRDWRALEDAQRVSSAAVRRACSGGPAWSVEREVRT